MNQPLSEPNMPAMICLCTLLPAAGAIVFLVGLGQEQNTSPTCRHDG